MNTATTYPRRAHTMGFTLVELMVVVAIIAILAALAYPSYQRQVVKTQRNAGAACLSQYAQFMERHYTTHLTYEGADPALGCAVEGNMASNYTFSATDLTASTYTVLATPTAAFDARDARCGTLTLDQAGQRGAAGGHNADDVQYCW